MEQQHNEPIPQAWELPPKESSTDSFPTGPRELILALLCLTVGLLLCNSVLFGGFNLGFAIFAGLSLLCAAGYLLATGSRLTGYSTALLLLSLLILAGFARSDDGFVKFVLVCFLLFSENLGLCLLAGQNRRSPNGISSVLDAPRTLFTLGMGTCHEAFRGLLQAFRRSGTVGKKGGAIALGCCIAIPILAILIPLLVSADAAFDGLLQLLPKPDFTELFSTVVASVFPVCVLYIRSASLKHCPKEAPLSKTARKGISPLTVNTVLIAVVLVYAVYLASQLAYFSGGFMGILPEGYTMAQYARRGFFEMAWLCAIDLGIMVLAVGLVSKQEKAPLSTRLLCLFIGSVTLFLVIAASAKMFLYIHSYGLTRLRVLTEVIMLWFGITTLTVSVWLFTPKLPYMKVVLLAGLVIGASVIWADVDTVVARYNVSAYRSGMLETVDVAYLSQLGSGAVPYLQQLTEDQDPQIAQQAKFRLNRRSDAPIRDFREWNYVSHIAGKHLPKPDVVTEQP